MYLNLLNIDYWMLVDVLSEFGIETWCSSNYLVAARSVLPKTPQESNNPWFVMYLKEKRNNFKEKGGIAQLNYQNKATPIIITDKDAKEDDQNPRVQLLEQKCTSIIDQLNSLFTRLDRKPETVVLCGTCEKLVSGQNLTNT